tara:strand:+ start:87 stop:290 length:204 start_codon:yes stop_codon:yes gene_type:complete
MKMKYGNIEIKTHDDNCLFVKIKGTTYYIDHSTKKMIVNVWAAQTEDDKPYRLMTDEIREKLKKESE